MPLFTPAPLDRILSAHVANLTNLLIGASGYGAAVSLTDYSSDSGWSLSVRNQGAGGQALRVQSATGATVFSVTDAGVSLSTLSATSFSVATISPISSTLSLAPAAGKTVSISQGWTEESVFALQVVKSFRGTGALVGSANATFNQIMRDDTTSGGDPTTVKVTQHWSGTSTATSATARGMELEVIRYAATAGTDSATQYGAIAGASMKFGSTRGIDIGLGHDPAITDPAIYTYGLCGLNVFNVGAASVDGKSWGSSGNKATAGLNIWGAAGFQYGIIYSGPSTPDQLLTTTTGRIFHIRESGGNDGLLYQTSNTVGTGIRFAASGGGGRNLDVFAVGSAVGAPHTGKVALYDSTGGIYLLSAGVNAGDTTKGQVGVIPGTAAYPGLVSYSHLTTGLLWPAANSLAVSANGAEVARFNTSGLGIGGTPSGNLLYLSGAAAIRIDNSANWQTTVGAAGGASALPATPLGYLKVNLGGSTVVIPYYNA